MQALQASRELVLIGGGHAHVQVLRSFGMRPPPALRVTVISRELHTPYSGMLPGLVAGHYTFDDVHIDLGPLARFARARLYHDEVVGLDLERRLVLCRERPPQPFDLLSIDIGVTPALDIEGAFEHGIAVKPVSNFCARWEQLRDRVTASRAALAIGVVGGGAGGVELVLAMSHRLRRARPAGAGALTFHLVTSGQDVLESHPPRVRAHARQALAAAGVVVHVDAPVVAANTHGVRTRDGTRIALDEVVWVTHAAAAPWLAASGLATDAAGFVAVEATLQSVSHPGVFAAGDIAAVVPHPRPKAGVFAVRQGPPLTANLRRAAAGEALQPFTPQRRFLGIISTGDRHAIASRGAFSAAGGWVWRWKDHIDRRFMARFRDLPPMTMAAAPADPAAAMRCGGCGAKVGAELLAAGLAGLGHAPRPDIVIGLDAPDDAAVVRLPPGTLAVHTVDAFRSFVDDPWLFGRIAANHSLGDIHAMGATAQSALAIVTLPLAAPRFMQRDLAQLLAGARSVFDPAGVVIVGGHTSEGAELSLGFAVNGYVEEAALTRKRGLVAGDALILTRALGSGVLLAGAMHGRGPTRWVEAALRTMGASSAQAAAVLRAHGAHALTDVTGFGLAGHLLEMIGDGACAAELALGALPLYTGALEFSLAGIESTLAPQNRAVLPRMEVAAVRAHAARLALLFDPQTAGGLLAAVPAATADACVTALRVAGYPDAAQVGTVSARNPGNVGLTVRD